MESMENDDEFNPSEEVVNQFQQTALNEVHKLNIGHPKDLDRLKNDKKWSRRFLIHTGLDKEKALTMIVETLKWRLKSGANDINHTNVNMDMLKSGALFPRCRDRDGKMIFIFKVKRHTKGIKIGDLKRVMIYWFDRLDRQEKGEKISIFFESTGAGLGNIDMDFVQYFISLIRDYYPNFVNFIYVFELPWILNAAWKIIKSWLPGKMSELVKFVGRSDLKQWVPVSEQLAEWGGKVDYKFVFEPEPAIPASAAVITNDVDNRKKVTFAEDAGSRMSIEPGNGDIMRNKPFQDQLLKMFPVEEVIFRRDENGETTGLLTITNISGCYVAYKIKTTSTEKYRVRPSFGVLADGENLSITFNIQSGYSASQLARDKFLIMAFKVENGNLNNQQLTEVWKKIEEDSIQNYRLRSSMAAISNESENNNNNNNTNNDVIATKLLQELAPQVEQILSEHSKLEKQLKQMKLILIVSLVLTIVIPFVL